VSRTHANAVKQLSRSVSNGALLTWTLLALGWGLLAGLALATALPSTRPDRVISLAALAAFPTPLWLLGMLSTPPHAACRRTLGQEAGAVLNASVGAGLRVIAASAAAPLAFAAAAALHPEAIDDLLCGAALVACAAVGSGLWAIAALAGALERIARGLQETWRALAGGGVFGPAETAPLLYAPAFAFVVSLLPVALLAAVWGARPGLLTPGAAWGAAAIALIIAAIATRRSLRALKPRAQAALLIVEQAHATPFATSETLPEAPAWLAPRRSDHDEQKTSAVILLGRSWIRRFPASAAVTIGLAVIASAAQRGPTGPWVAAVACLAIVAYSITRVVDLRRVDPDVHGAARWLGASDGEVFAAERRLGLHLGLPALACVGIAWSATAWWPAGAGAIAGAALSWPLLKLRGRPHLVAWTGRLLLASALLLAAAPAPRPAPAEAPTTEVAP